MTPRIKNMTAGIRGRRSEPTIAAGYARALMQLAVSKGASRKNLAGRSGIDPGELQDQDNRIPLAKYVALMRAGQELATILRSRCISAKRSIWTNCRSSDSSASPARRTPTPSRSSIATAG